VTRPFDGAFRTQRKCRDSRGGITGMSGSSLRCQEGHEERGRKNLLR